MVTLHEVITFLVSMQISISSLQTHNVNRCGRSRHLARKLSLRRKRSSRSEERRVGKELRSRWSPYNQENEFCLYNMFMNAYHTRVSIVCLSGCTVTYLT